ncbi:uncharacterized protein LOC120103878 isoform X2 [Phoenix dactylifera]|uniref:Uncharacterized protein LOC120103878 isoform X2 n=1 Tax=Phoenix dactylifera TaxID=42345 RepID=A0A8B9A4A6_PHODC|nr:uncharacterized protein LOC120103878 isoform X2 [Phoenix dactylifera]
MRTFFLLSGAVSFKRAGCPTDCSRAFFPSLVGEMADATAAPAAPAKEEAAEEKTVMVVGIDDSEHSYYALEWTLEHFFSPKVRGPNPAFRLVIVHAKPSPSSVVSLAGPGAADVLPFVDADLRKSAARIVEKAREDCVAKSVSALFEVVEGDARNVLCEAVEKHHADMLVVGNHGYGAIKRNSEQLYGNANDISTWA